MKNYKIIRLALVWIALGLHFSIVRPVRADYTNFAPLFQYAIFYDGLMEFTDCAPLDINGPVHCNTNIYVGCPSGSTLSFNDFVTSSLVITNPSWFGYQQSQFVTTNIAYNGTPSPGWADNTPVRCLPIGTNHAPAGMREILNLPQPGELSTDPIWDYALDKQ